MVGTLVSLRFEPFRFVLRCFGLYGLLTVSHAAEACRCLLIFVFTLLRVFSSSVSFPFLEFSQFREAVYSPWVHTSI